MSLLGIPRVRTRAGAAKHCFEGMGEMENGITVHFTSIIVHPYCYLWRKRKGSDKATGIIGDEWGHG